MMRARCFNEVIELHHFIQDWLTGSVGKTSDVFSRFYDVLADDFQIIHPGGTTEHRIQISDSFWSAHGTKDRSFSIEIRNLHHRISFGRYIVVTYEEWQCGQTTTARLSTALLRGSDQHERMQWVHLHETWLSNE